MDDFTVTFGGKEITVSHPGAEGRKEAAWKVWDMLGDCPINDDDEIDEDFLGYPAGTDRFDIWHDIEDELGVPINRLMFEEPPRGVYEALRGLEEAIDSAIEKMPNALRLLENEGSGDSLGEMYKAGKGVIDLFIDGRAKITVDIRSKLQPHQIFVSPTNFDKDGCFLKSPHSFMNMEAEGYAIPEATIEVYLSKDAQELGGEELTHAVEQGIVIASGQEECPEGGIVAHGSCRGGIGLHAGPMPRAMRENVNRFVNLTTDTLCSSIKPIESHPVATDTTRYLADLTIMEKSERVEFELASGIEPDVRSAIISVMMRGSDCNPLESSIDTLSAAIQKQHLETLLDSIEENLSQKVELVISACKNDLYDDLDAAGVLGEAAIMGLPEIFSRNSRGSLDEMMSAKITEAEFERDETPEMDNDLGRE